MVARKKRRASYSKAMYAMPSIVERKDSEQVNATALLESFEAIELSVTEELEEAMPTRGLSESDKSKIATTSASKYDQSALRKR